MRGNPPWHAAEPLLARTRATPDRTAVIDATGEAAADAQSWSYRRLHAATDVVTERLQALLPPEPSSKRIGLAVSPRVPYIVTLYAALRLGWAVVPLDPAMTGRELDERLRRTVADAVRDGVDAGEFADADPEAAARFVVTAMNGAHAREVALGEDPGETRALIEAYLASELGIDFDRGTD